MKLTVQITWKPELYFKTHLQIAIIKYNLIFVKINLLSK